jgi:hypothetical protein
VEVRIRAQYPDYVANELDFRHEEAKFGISTSPSWTSLMPSSSATVTPRVGASSASTAQPPPEPEERPPQKQARKSKQLIFFSSRVCFVCQNNCSNSTRICMGRRRGRVAHCPKWYDDATRAGQWPDRPSFSSQI